MVLIGYSGVKEPKPSYFWNAWSACTADQWKMDAVNESEKISKMKRHVLIEYIMDLTTSQSVSAVLNMRKQYLDLRKIGAQDVFATIMKNIFDKLQSRLHETVGDADKVFSIQNNEDITNIEKVMAGNVSTADFTALFLVHQYILRQAKLEAELEPASHRNIRHMNENQLCNHYLKGFKQWLIEITVGVLVWYRRRS